MYIIGFKWWQFQCREAIRGGQNEKVFHLLAPSYAHKNHCPCRCRTFIIVLLFMLSTIVIQYLFYRLYSKLRRKRGSSVNLPPSPTPRCLSTFHIFLFSLFLSLFPFFSSSFWNVHFSLSLFLLYHVASNQSLFLFSPIFFPFSLFTFLVQIFLNWSAIFDIVSKSPSVSANICYLVSLQKLSDALVSISANIWFFPSSTRKSSLMSANIFSPSPSQIWSNKYMQMSVSNSSKYLPIFPDTYKWQQISANICKCQPPVFNPVSVCLSRARANTILPLW